ncbi:hypothetical protein AN2341V1_5382, partial [Klebsiella pneumoniae]
VAPTDDQLNGLNFAGVVTLNRPGKAQLHAVHRGFAHLFKQKRLSAADGHFRIQRAIIQPQINTD